MPSTTRWSASLAPAQRQGIAPGLALDSWARGPLGSRGVGLPGLRAPLPRST